MAQERIASKGLGGYDRVMTEKGYSKAPITEALIDLRVTLPPEFVFTALRDIQRDIAGEYPIVEDIIDIQSQLLADSALTTTTTTTQTPVGCRFMNVERNQIVQVRSDGFTFSRLAPYGKWGDVRDEAKRLWQLYKEKVSPEEVVRVAVRYINRLDLPLPLNDFKDYLLTVPEVAPGISQSLSDYFMRLVIEQPDLEGWLILQEAIIPPPAGVEDVVSVVLDLDLACEVSFPADEEGCWNLLEKLRVRKNEVFEACITEKAKELFQ